MQKTLPVCWYVHFMWLAGTHSTNLLLAGLFHAIPMSCVLSLQQQVEEHAVTACCLRAACCCCKPKCFQLLFVCCLQQHIQCTLYTKCCCLCTVYMQHIQCTLYTECFFLCAACYDTYTIQCYVKYMQNVFQSSHS